MSKIIVDGVFFQKNKTGIARLWKSLLEEWVKDGFAEQLIVINRGGTLPKIDGITSTMTSYYIERIYSESLIIQDICDSWNAKAFISSYYTTPITTMSVFMAYDMIPEVMKFNLDETMWRQKHHAIKLASAHIAISENTAKDLKTYFPDVRDVKVAYCGVNHDIFKPRDESAIDLFKYKYNLTKPYFMIMSGGGYKNPELFYQAMSKLSNKEEFEIVATSSGGLLAPENTEFIPKDIFINRLELSDEELSLAYGGSIALVYPSKYEGFGLPVLEAMACGTPVITTRNSSIPEVCGEAALYVKDDDVEGLTVALEIIQVPYIREELIKRGLEKAKQFSWAKMAKEVKEVLLEVIK
jgi:glycosyltransferase involved in cell wall biosynthesis